MRRAFSLVEVMLALALLAVLAAPALVVLTQSDTPLPPALVTARRLADRLVSVLARLEPEDLDALAKSAAADAFASFDPSKVPGVDAAGLADLALQAGVRLVRHAGGQFGLDRLDLELTFSDGRRRHRLTRSVLRRNEPQLAALARVRLHGDIAALTDQELADGLEFAVYQDGLNDRAGFAEGALYPARVYPPLLAEFEPAPGADPREQALGDRRRLLTPYFTAGGNVPRPRFAAGVGVAH